jgi:hypothetical protein
MDALDKNANKPKAAVGGMDDGMPASWRLDLPAMVVV